ncbi:MAG: phage tail protein [Oscillospiraceae bacterium]|nr:phage tail protein [Oscillospiraceae bacterium]MBR5873308.1 phage tail protein [Oscillospiraceae bacterium]
MAISTLGVALKIGEQEVVIKDFPSLLGKRSALETTTLSDDAQTYIAGIRQQEESFDFLANYDATVYQTLNAIAEAQNCELSFSDGSKYAWEGTVSVSVNEGGVDEVIEMTISITPSTVPVWSKGA